MYQGEIPSAESEGRKHEKTRPLGEVELEVVRDTSLHDQLGEEQNPTLMSLHEQGYSIDQIYQFRDQEGYVYVQVDVTDLDTSADFTALLEGWGIDESDWVGYGTGRVRVGFCQVQDLIQQINRYDIGDSEHLSLFIPMQYE